MAAWTNKTVLVVDDSQRVQEQLKRVYSDAGMQVVGVARNGILALEQIAKLKPDLVSLDIVMPVMDGIECFRKLRGMADLSVRTLFVSCLASEPRLVSAYAEEIPDYYFLAKMPSVKQLAERLDKVFAERVAKMLPPPPTARENNDPPPLARSA